MPLSIKPKSRAKSTCGFGASVRVDSVPERRLRCYKSYVVPAIAGRMKFDMDSGDINSGYLNPGEKNRGHQRQAMAVEIAGAAPVGPGERISSIDVLRGVALLGILIMNIQSFSMIMAAYMNPTAYGDLSGANWWVWTLSNIFANEKFISIFSMLFGAGIVLMAERAEARGASPKRLHVRRSISLIVIGLLHAHLLWYGDILFTYGICALIVFAGRKAPPKKLIMIGLIVFSVAFLLFMFFGFSLQFWPEENRAESMHNWMPTAEQVAEELAAYRGNWLEQMSERIPSAIALQTFIFLILEGWRVCGLMLIGMALYKTGVLSAARSARFYANMVWIGYGVGLPLVIAGTANNFAAGWSFEYSMFYGAQWNYWASIFVAMGHVGVIMLFCRSGRLGGIKRVLAAFGRMALTNYLMQTVICTTIFYGHGLGLFGRVERWQQILFVLAIWILQLIYSPLWLSKYRFGPAEWAWRSLTYGKRQPMRI